MLVTRRHMEVWAVNRRDDCADLYRGNGVIITRTEWLELRGLVDAFFSKATDADIAEYNDEKKREEAAVMAESAEGGSSNSEPIEPIRGYIYLIHGEGTQWYKIGLSVRPDDRLKQLGTQGPFPHRLLHTFGVDDMYGTESVLHSFFASKRAGGEWFTLDADDVALIQGLKCRTVRELRSVLAAAVIL